MSTIITQENLKKFSDIEACPIRNIVSRFSGKWSMLILCILAENQAIRFNTIGKAIPDISPKMLTETLKNLETDGLVKRKVYAEVPPRVEYSLTDRSFSLLPIIDNLISWAVDNMAPILKDRERNTR